MSEEPINNTSIPSLPPGLLEGLLSNPEMLKRIGSIIGAMSSAAPTEAPTTPNTASSASETYTEPERISTAPNNSETGDGLTSLLSNPVLLEQLPQMLAVMKPLMASMQQQPKATPPQTQKKSSQDCRDNLLLALKPFLSDERRQAVDSIIRISRLGAVFNQLK